MSSTTEPNDESASTEPLGLESAEEHPTAILTDAQRAFLRGEKDYTRQGKSTARRRIQARIRAAMHDLALLTESLNSNEIGMIYAPDTGEEPAPAWPLAAFLYATRDNDIVPVDIREERGSKPLPKKTYDWRADSIAREVERGVSKAIAARELTPARSVKCDIDIKPGLSLPDHADTLADLSRDELDALFSDGEIDRDTYADAMADRLGREE